MAKFFRCPHPASPSGDEAPLLNVDQFASVTFYLDKMTGRDAGFAMAEFDPAKGEKPIPGARIVMSSGEEFPVEDPASLDELQRLVSA